MEKFIMEEQSKKNEIAFYLELYYKIYTINIMATIKDHYYYPYDPSYHVYKLDIVRKGKCILFMVPNKYNLIKYLGGGVFGDVCSAVNIETGAIVAIKRIEIKNNQLLDDVITILHEISTMRCFTFHSEEKKSNILPLYTILPPPKDITESTFNEIYLVTKLYDYDLATSIKTNMFKQKNQYMTIMYNILVGIKQLHDKQILHGDIKPCNIYCNSDCDVVLGDYGLSQRFSTKKCKSPTKLRYPIITLWYRPPELLLNKKCEYDGAVDIWSVGCVFIELLSGKPFRGMNSPNQYIVITHYFGSAPLSASTDENTEKTFHELYNRHGIFTKEERINKLHRLIPESYWDDKLFDMLAGMLDMNPVTRKTATELLEHPYFENIYNEADINVPTSPFKYKESYPLIMEYDDIHTWSMEKIKRVLWYEAVTRGYSHFVIHPGDLPTDETCDRDNIQSYEELEYKTIMHCIAIAEFYRFAVKFAELVSREMFQRTKIAYNGLSAYNYANMRDITHIVNDAEHHIIIVYDEIVQCEHFRIQYNYSDIIYRIRDNTYSLLQNLYDKLYKRLLRHFEYPVLIKD